MLFNTFLFTLVFLPLALGVYYLISKTSLFSSIAFLFLASLVFYSIGGARYLPLLLASILLNYIAGKTISKAYGNGYFRKAKILLVAGLVTDLAVLIFFKYADFVGNSIASMTGIAYSPLGVGLPIGISFFTFTQIAYLVDCHSGKVQETRPASYGLFVTYFPHLIAGPILHHKEMMPQFEDRAAHTFHRGRLVLGICIFTLGLFKKVILADGVARFVGPVFDTPDAHLTMPEAWCGALAYTFQLYFDFSAYSDMAYALSYMFGIVLPINFNSPYKARSIIEFWRRWHMTLSRFLRDYLYIPLGGNRQGPRRRHVNLLITMMLGGLWHGANWTFIVWGALHGCYLIVNHGARRWIPPRPGRAVGAAGAVLTFAAVVVAWVFFRATSLGSAVEVLRAMFSGAIHPAQHEVLLGSSRLIDLRECATWLAALAGICFCLPNAYDLFGTGKNVVMEVRLGGSLGAFVLGILTLVIFVLLSISETRGLSEFLYFNF